MIIGTWNVLHRIHAVNWNEPAIARHTDEAERVAAIARFVVEHPVDIWCLQEVSGDQLAALHAAFTAERVLATCYPRVPKLWKGKRAVLDDAREYLVSIAAGRLAHTASFDD